MQDIVIHGASSFLGKHFIKRLLSEKINIIVIARQSTDLGLLNESSLVTIFRYKSCIEEVLNIYKPIGAQPVFYEFSWHGVYGEQRNDPEQLTTNIPLILASVNFAKEINAKQWTGIGSQAEYGNLNKKISEADVCTPTTLYGKSKLICSEISSALCSSYGMEHSWLRLFSVFGPEDNHNWLIPYLIKDMLINKPVNATKGEQSWDYLYIDDVTEVLYKLIKGKGAGIANLGSGKSIKIKDLILKIKELTGSDSQINFGAIPYRDDQVMLMEADIQKLSESLNWIPRVSIEDGLKKTIKYFSEKTEQNN